MGFWISCRDCYLTSSEMRYIAAYLLATMGGNPSPSADDVKQILGSVGVDVDEEQLNIVIQQLAGKDVNEVMASGAELLASVPSGGAAAAAGGAAAADAPAEEAKEEVKEESESESDDDMGFDLFG